MYYTTLTLDYIDWLSYDHVWNDNIATLDIVNPHDYTLTTTLYYSIKK